jgi:hypothetical protein
MFISVTLTPVCFLAFGFAGRTATTDVEFQEMNKKFTECEKATATLLDEVCKYRDSVTGNTG